VPSNNSKRLDDVYDSINSILKLPQQSVHGNILPPLAASRENVIKSFMNRERGPASYSVANIYMEM
jgi:hypothetical protein